MMIYLLKEHVSWEGYTVVGYLPTADIPRAEAAIRRHIEKRHDVTPYTLESVSLQPTRGLQVYEWRGRPDWWFELSPLASLPYTDGSLPAKLAITVGTGSSKSTMTLRMDVAYCPDTNTYRRIAEEFDYGKLPGNYQVVEGPWVELEDGRVVHNVAEGASEG